MMRNQTRKCVTKSETPHSFMNCTCTPRVVRLRTVARRSSRLRARRFHRVHEDGVAVADKREHRFQLRAVEIFAGHAVGEGPVDVDAVELAVGVLLDRGDPRVGDALPGDDVS